MKKLCEEQSCPEHRPVTPAEIRTMLTENTAKQKNQGAVCTDAVQGSSTLVCVGAQFFFFGKEGGGTELLKWNKT